MIILAINKFHNASATLMVDGEIVFHIESERLSRYKRDNIPFYAMKQITKYVDHIDILAISGMIRVSNFDTEAIYDAYSAYIFSLGKSFRDHEFIVYDLSDRHHEIHALTAFYNSGFDSALCIVKDGSGSLFLVENPHTGQQNDSAEATSSFIVEYPYNTKCIDKQLSMVYHKKIEPFRLEDGFCLVSDSISEGKAYEALCHKYNLAPLDAGKIMGMAAYGRSTDKFKIYDENGLINSELFGYSEDRTPMLKIDIEEDFQSRADLALSLQSSVEKNVTEYVLKMLEKTQHKNLCLSGGFFLNCSTNYRIAKSIPDDVNLYVEPVSSDAGNSIGAAKAAHYLVNGYDKKRKQNSIYLGPIQNISTEKLSKENWINCSPDEVARLISEKNIVAIFQSRSEAGPRALGNRSILYDPRDPDGKDIVNTVKGREWYRPFAGSILEEFSEQWFDMANLKNSKFMMFAVQVKEDKKSIIPCIIHEDNSCRIQTVSEKDNKYFYELINSFYKLTGVPILFNTSFNLAGEPLVETVEDAIQTFKNSNINYLYFPEIGALLTK